MALKKHLGLLDVFCVASGAMISSGLFVLPAIVFAGVGPYVPWCYLLAAVFMIPALVSKAELATAIPKSGGTYFFIDRSVGPAVGTLGGIAAWSSLAFKTAFALLGMGLFMKLVVPGLTDMQVKLIGIGFTVFFTILNLLGAKHAGRLQVGFVLALLALLGAYVAAGLGKIAPAKCAAHPFPGVTALVAGAGLVFISFGGVTKVASIGEEVKDPGRNLALGMILSFVVVSALYVAVVLVTVTILPNDLFAETRTPISEGGRVLWKNAGLILMSVAALLAFISTANAGILAASRVPMAMSRDGLLPEVLGRVSRKRGTPHMAILLTSVLIAVALCMPLELFVKSASTMMILLFIFTILSVILMRESRMAGYRPKFRSPFYPWLHAAGIICYCFLLVELGTKPLLIAVAILGAAFAWYMFFVRVRVVRESALTHLARRIASRALDTHDLESELVQIVQERDHTQEDDFDRMVKKCLILDLPGRITHDELFHTLAAHIGTALDMPAADVHRLLNEREETGSTVVRPGLAIPHIVVEGTGQFDVVLVRCREGIMFEEHKEPVHTVFVLVGSKDAREQHLRSLMAVAEIAQDPNFERRWLRARDEEELRQLVLRSKRRREVIVS